MKTIVTTAFLLLTGVAGLNAKPYMMTASLENGQRIEIELEEGETYNQITERDGDSQTILMAIESVSNNYRVFQKPLNMLRSLSLNDAGGVGQVVSDASVQCSYKEGMLTLVSTERPTMLSIAAPDGTLLMERQVTSETVIRLKDLGTGIRIITFGEANFKILVH